MKIVTTLFGTIVVMCLLVGCGSSNANLQRATGSKLGVHPDTVSISDAKIGMTEYRWNAETDGKKYNCFSDDRMRDVSCVPIKKK
jgi:hypothetical protein